ncbi:uncharacterized protein F5147DRAFT_187392 [Suillus discolor]|uniref:Uncharacterized protein n=1 Tax=Suillus discolor TaxID=1912936 RepID=A0A9P7FJV6_9AGAM|nr:uncharacterized protein F5147DRAFT_187392 [Suillus discolor]KAG2118788.1 hypothetical protein F5147DRAFT_187392 [Suillus discolor]
MMVASSGSGVRIEYQQRHNFFIDCLAEEVHLHAVPAVAGVWEGRTVYQASSKVKKSAGIKKYSARNHTMFSFISPGAGMYLWMKFHLNQLDPSFAPGDEDTLDTKLWIKLPENGVLSRPGWMFTANAMIKNSHSTDSSSSHDSSESSFKRRTCFGYRSAARRKQRPPYGPRDPDLNATILLLSAN